MLRSKHKKETIADLRKSKNDFRKYENDFRKYENDFRKSNFDFRKYENDLRKSLTYGRQNSTYGSQCVAFLLTAWALCAQEDENIADMVNHMIVHVVLIELTRSSPILFCDPAHSEYRAVSKPRGITQYVVMT